ncbi:hypothetical protein EVAR_80774_1 [Eumeta japonica]|uniref:Endonuclease/exonuclease/phosphatase domain-containing protein n=1 Tax=Eumeta variegata TaxID=151549 RepID=A0A4C1XAY9_EUMVA|nr:hypothetical protein EVAR_80774_1 [Eumeta japonica]
MQNKELEIELFMSYANIDILCITEHWLRNYQLQFGFVNHQVASSFSRERSIRGGSLILIRNNLKFKERKDIVSLSVERVIEIACVELERLVVMSVYRPPHSSYELFESVMDQALCKINDKSKQIAICGDFNVDLLDASNRGGEILEFSAVIICLISFSSDEDIFYL